MEGVGIPGLAMASAFRRCASRAFRHFSTSSPYGSAPPATTESKVTVRTLAQMRQKGQKIACVTAYDHPSAVHGEMAGADLLLVGDSAAMVVHGHETTLPITLEEMVWHCKSVRRGAKRAMVVGDLPFGSYEASTTQAVHSAVELMQKGGADAVKLEGGAPDRTKAAMAVVRAGCATMGHVGLTPQAVSTVGGFRPAARNAKAAEKVIDEALALQDAGCFSLVLECVPAAVAAAVTSALSIPTIGIGAGRYVDGQVLVYHDLVGMHSHPHHAKVAPRFCKQYAQVGPTVIEAIRNYCDEVRGQVFPHDKYAPYRIGEEDLEQFAESLARRGLHVAAEAATSVSGMAATEEEHRKHGG